jgi:hypothetical protein
MVHKHADYHTLSVEPAAITAQAHVVDGALEVAGVVTLDQDIVAITGYIKVTLEQLYQAVKPHGQVLRGDRCLHP